MTEEEMIRLLADGRLAATEIWRAVVEYMREAGTLVDLEAAIARGDLELASRIGEAAGKRLAEEYIRQFTVAALAAARSVSGETSRLISFNGANELAVRALNAQRLELVAGTTREVRELMQSVISDGLRRGLNPRDMAIRFRDSLGLTATQESYVENYRQALIRGDTRNVLGRRLHDGRLPVGRDLLPSTIDRYVESYRQRWIASRADTIARSMALPALHEGVEELYRQAFASGELDPSEVVVTWASALRAGTRDHHRSMHGQRRAPGQSFQSGHGVALRYPGDPSAPASETANCLCVLQRRLEVAGGSLTLYR